MADDETAAQRAARDVRTLLAAADQADDTGDHVRAAELRADARMLQHAEAQRQRAIAETHRLLFDVSRHLQHAASGCGTISLEELELEQPAMRAVVEQFKRLGARARLLERGAG